MIGSFLTRGLVMVFGYAYPAYECYKTVEQNKPEIQQLRFWCQYWILVAVLTVCERVGDTFVSWVPMYSEAKLAFYIYLWYPKTRGTTYVYDSFFRPYVAKHENEIDRNLIELRTRAGDMVVLYCQRAATYGQTRFFEILQFIAEQSTPKPRPQEKQPPPPPASSAPSSPQQQAPKESQAPKLKEAPNDPPYRVALKKPQPLSIESLSPKPTSSPRKQQQTEVTETKLSPSQNKATPPISPSPKAKHITPPEKPAVSPSPTKAEALQIVAAAPSVMEENKDAQASSKESIMEETIRVTRGRLRKTRLTGTR